MAALAEPAALGLGLFHHRRGERIILGAWGAGAVRNDPHLVARTFRTLLDGPYRGVFREVVFAVFATPWKQRTLDAFRETWPGTSAGPG